MSENGNGDGCLSHHIHQHIQVRRDFLEICGYDANWFNQKKDQKGKIVKDEPNLECMAKILRLMETLTDKRRRELHDKAEEAKSKGLAIKEAEEYPLELAYSAICQLLFYTYGESTVRNSIAALIRFGYIKRYPSTNNNIPRYVLNIKVVQMALKRHTQEVFENGNLGMPVVFNRQPVKNNRQPVKNNRQPVENNNNNISNNNGDNTDERKKDRFVRKFNNLRTHIPPFSLLQEKFDPWHKKASQGDYIGAAVELVLARSPITAAAIEKFLSKYIDVEGSTYIHRGDMNLLYWDNMSEQFANILMELIKHTQVQFNVTTSALYEVEGHTLDHPVAQDIKKMPEKHWLPIVFVSR